MSFSHQIKTSKSDEYYTPAYAVKLILPYLKAKGYSTIWCPFDKVDSEFVKILRAEGYDVIHGHIETGQDFFEQEVPVGTDCVVSNPPFSKRDLVFERLYEIGLPFAMIMNSNGLFDSKKRWKLFSNNDFELLVPKGRMRFFDETMVQKNSPNFQSVYVCNNILERQIVFTDMDIK
ncbi:hypothetical protein J5583_06775 [Streptococcus suis]|uniref:hypothetical protein n=1 Tax=Streptococcus suis TaxID=1307 RepID=UPI001ABEAD85|nr:hypothetical protein [Streptococcus suis]MBO4109864.1 hypothetical protein [Streptococcus suis]